MSDKKIIHVVAAVIKNEDKYLATQRGYGEFKGMWEFPGGKINPGEKQKQALIREIKEELNVNILVQDYLCTVVYEYPTFHLIMDTFICTLENNKLEKVYHNNNELEHEDYKWLTIKDIDTVNWLPADIQIIDKLKSINNN